MHKEIKDKIEHIFGEQKTEKWHRWYEKENKNFFLIKILTSEIKKLWDELRSTLHAPKERISELEALLCESIQFQ